jgi:deoxyadenosine/deoxycytidine kinase
MLLYLFYATAQAWSMTLKAFTLINKSPFLMHHLSENEPRNQAGYVFSDGIFCAECHNQLE